ncbi:MAG: hypothetical protein ACI835_004725 [Planctomycetota bacterium]|jgi:hypothetical protein
MPVTDEERGRASQPVDTALAQLACRLFLAGWVLDCARAVLVPARYGDSSAQAQEAWWTSARSQPSSSASL